MKPSQLFKVLRSWSCILFFLPLITLAQEPEQDCIGAIVVTSSPDTFSYYVSFGWDDELSYPLNTSCLIGGEENSVWITFTICDTGILLFQISPEVLSNDFDWALYDFTNLTCANVFDSSNEVRCNYSASPGPTGLDIQSTTISASGSDYNQCKPLHPLPNQRYLLLVNNHASSFTGFVLTFGGTAILCSAVGIPEISGYKFFLSPNPTDGLLQLKNLPARNDLSIEVMNVYGNKVYRKELNGIGDNQLNLPPLLPDGFYVLRILEKGKLFGEEAFIISR